MKAKLNLLATGIFLAALGTGLGQLVITQQPQSCTNAVGTTATFRVVATGAEPLTCQWQKQSGTWSDLAGCTESNLVLTNVQTSHAGNYRVAITNVAGATNSDVAHLDIIVPPRISALSTDLAIPSGARGYFSVSAVGTSPLSYQWCQDGIAIPGATNASVNLYNAQRANAGAYSVVVTNLAGAITSRMAQLSVAEGWIFTNTQGTRLPYRLFFPSKYDPNAKYPLVLFWHGAGEVGADNVRQLYDNGQFSFLTASNQAKFPCFYLAPQLPHPPNSSGEANSYLDWATNLLSELEEEFSIDPDRVYVTGLSMGGYASWMMVARCPDRLAAAIPMSGGWPWITIQDFLRSLRVPVWNFHAADDGTVGVAGSDVAVGALREAGASVIYTRYQLGGHGIWPTAYNSPGLVDWIMAQRLGVAPTNEPLLLIASPTAQAGLFTGATNLNLDGAAAALARDVTRVTWTNFANNAKGVATGTNLWSAANIPLVTNKTNVIAVVATTTSWAPAYGGNTTFNDTLTVIQSPLRATLAVQGTEVLLNWTGGGPPYRVQRATDLTAGDWTDFLNDATPPVPLPLTNYAGFYRIVGQ